MRWLQPMGRRGAGREGGTGRAGTAGAPPCGLPLSCLAGPACPRETLVCTWGWGEARAPSCSGAPLPRTEKGPGTGAGGDAWFTPPSCWEVCLFVLIVKDLDLFVRENSKESTLSKIQGSRWFLAVTPYHSVVTVSHDGHGVTPRPRCRSAVARRGSVLPRPRSSSGSLSLSLK